MSEDKDKPAPKDRTALYIAILGATATVIAALIGVLPNLLNRDTAAAPAVITATFVPTTVAQATEPPATSAPTGTPASAPSATPTPPPPAPPTLSNVVTLVLSNNLPFPVDFFIDGESVTALDSGAYKALPVTRGAHEFKQCFYGADPTRPENCFAKTTTIVNSPDYWELFDSANSPLATDDVVLLVLNQGDELREIYIDGQHHGDVPAHEFKAVTLPRGAHVFQACLPAMNPQSGNCRAARELDLLDKTETISIQSESS